MCPVLYIHFRVKVTTLCGKPERLALTVTSSVVIFLKAITEPNPNDLRVLLALPANNVLRRKGAEVTNTLAYYANLFVIS